MQQKFSDNKILTAIIVILISGIIGSLSGLAGGMYLFSKISHCLYRPSVGSLGKTNNQHAAQHYTPQTTQEEKVIRAVKNVSPSVVSIIITKDVPVFEQYYTNPFPDFPEFKQFFGEPFFEFGVPNLRQKGTEKKEIGGGTGFIVSKDGLILTNSHVVSDKKADYTVFTNKGKKYKAKVLARDPVRDLAVVKIEAKESLPVVKLGDSDKLQIGQTVIAIGNALGEFRNTVSVGVISGLGRRVTASGGTSIETLENVIQTDAAINPGNSGGPLLNLKGEVIGINFAMAQSAENIGFAIPINRAKEDIKQVETSGKIVYPYLGIWYWNINSDLQKQMDLPIDHGAWITRWNRDQYGHWYKMEKSPIVAGSAADKAGLKENDIILELNGEKITPKNSLANIIMKYKPGDKVTLKILRKGKEKTITVTLGERKP